MLNDLPSDNNVQQIILLKVSNIAINIGIKFVVGEMNNKRVLNYSTINILYFYLVSFVFYAWHSTQSWIF